MSSSVFVAGASCAHVIRGKKSDVIEKRGRVHNAPSRFLHDNHHLKQRNGQSPAAASLYIHTRFLTLYYTCLPDVRCPESTATPGLPAGLRQGKLLCHPAGQGGQSMRITALINNAEALAIAHLVIEIPGAPEPRTAHASAENLRSHWLRSPPRSPSPHQLVCCTRFEPYRLGSARVLVLQGD